MIRDWQSLDFTGHTCSGDSVVCLWTKRFRVKKLPAFHRPLSGFIILLALFVNWLWRHKPIHSLKDYIHLSMRVISCSNTQTHTDHLTTRLTTKTPTHLQKSPHITHIRHILSTHFVHTLKAQIHLKQSKIPKYSRNTWGAWREKKFHSFVTLQGETLEV